MVESTYMSGKVIPAKPLKKKVIYGQLSTLSSDDYEGSN
jgi:hypothetical protein